MILREAENMIKKIHKSFKVLLVTGPRQVGKTTLLLSLKPKDMEYITLDDEVLRNMARTDPKLFLEEHPAPLFIDEVQYAPELFSYIKMVVDQTDKNGLYWLTGSQQFHLMKNVSESLAGRVGIVNLNSFTYKEIVGNHKSSMFDPEQIKKYPPISVNEVFDIIYKGGMPRLYSEKNISRDLYFEGYIDTYISRDVKNFAQVGNELSFRQFLVSVASRTGEPLKYSLLAKDASISIPTAKNWLSILITAGLVYLLEPFASSELKRLTHMPKIIFMDTGLACYLAGWTSKTDLQQSAQAGHFLETFIISELIKSYNANGIKPYIYYYRDKEKNEIDLIFYKNNTLYPFEIKKTGSPNKEMVKNFKKLEDSNKKIGAGGIICFYDKLMRLDEKNYIIPISSVIGGKENK